MTGREKYLEDLIAQTFSDEEGQHICPNDFYDAGSCEECEMKDLCKEAKNIVERAGTAK